MAYLTVLNFVEDSALEAKDSVEKLRPSSAEIHKEHSKAFTKILCDKLQEENISFQRNKSVIHNEKTVESDVWINGVVFVNIKSKPGEYTPEDKTLMSSYKRAMDLPGILVCFEENGKHHILEI
ncbi:UNVERIFIED_CONTAM: hypothetical protein RMT77_016123 [Armadillidium vulgare]